jgi:hypothetical protein
MSAAQQQRCHVWTPAGAAMQTCVLCGARCRRDRHGKITAFAISGINDDALTRELGLGPLYTRRTMP